jgi:hypothetical protein
MDENDLLDRATTAYLGWCKKRGCLGDQPCRDRSEVVCNIIHLRNVNGDLARYRVADAGNLRRLLPSVTTMRTSSDA